MDVPERIGKSLFDTAVSELKAQIVDELEQRVWERLEPRIQQQLVGRHLTIEECAQYLHVSGSTIRRLIREKSVSFFRVRGQIFLRQMDVDQWVQLQVEEARQARHGNAR